MCFDTQNIYKIDTMFSSYSPFGFDLSGICEQQRDLPFQAPHTTGENFSVEYFRRCRHESL